MTFTKMRNENIIQCFLAIHSPHVYQSWQEAKFLYIWYRWKYTFMYMHIYSMSHMLEGKHYLKPVMGKKMKNRHRNNKKWNKLTY